MLRWFGQPPCGCGLISGWIPAQARDDTEGRKGECLSQQLGVYQSAFLADDDAGDAVAGLGGLPE